MEASSSHSSERLLEWLQDIYTWMSVWGNGVKVQGTRRNIDTRDFERAKQLFEDNWAAMLTLEREKAVNIVLKVYCSICGSRTIGAEELKKLKWTAISTTIGFSHIYHARSQEGPSSRRLAWASPPADFVVAENTINLIGQRIVDLFPAGAANTWGNTLGVEQLRPKLSRVRVEATQVLIRQLESLETAISSQNPRDRLVTSLPSADALLGAAQHAARPAGERFRDVAELLSGLVKLYYSGTGLNRSSPEVKDRDMQAIEEAVSSILRPEALQHFAGLSHQQQEHAVNTVRAELFNACKELNAHKRLPVTVARVNGMPEGVTHRIFAALSNPELQFAALSNAELQEILEEDPATTSAVHVSICSYLC